MFAKMDNSGVEDICYEDSHVEKVLAEIKGLSMKSFSFMRQPLFARVDDLSQRDIYTYLLKLT